MVVTHPSSGDQLCIGVDLVTVPKLKEAMETAEVRCEGGFGRRRTMGQMERQKKDHFCFWGPVCLIVCSEAVCVCVCVG